MRKIKPNRFYICPKSGYVVETRVPDRVPVLKLHRIVKDLRYFVDSDGKLSTTEGPAVITPELAEVLERCLEAADVKHYNAMRENIATKALAAILSNRDFCKECTVLASRANIKASDFVVDTALDYGTLLAKRLIETEESWLQEVKYI